ncbi:sugar phosphate isomerase/epimerase family protein [Mycobacterium marseillense]|uniref:Xylose isomerase n=1 Tax=Mycobacterium marseillense TaxID=701042 RepID=A0ABN5ZZU1_9MYCO|nr:TIM barrel protein [Mycobacterium marseillense]MCV7404764.1 sugar phosphate isomerase/epimerase [Mycobacterium marseillense]ORA95479.1 xylose isomerase [Mycobacterium marseillense]BBY12916.1 xylose isomerase [Mycobacterium marseillense]
MPAHERLSVHNVTFYGSSLAELERHWVDLGVSRLSVLDGQVLDPEFREMMQRNDFAVEAVCHIFAGGRLSADCQSARDALMQVIDAAAGVDARVVYMLTGGREALGWAQAADRFTAMVAPCVDHAKQAGVALAIENASSLYADIHLAHTLRDTVTLAEMSGLGVCIELFHCWAEGDLDAMVQRALPRTELIQLSDYVLGDRALPGRAVPGDGAIPIETFVARALAGGYSHGFDLELIGPRIDEEGRLESARRACDVVGAMLDRLGA